MTFKEFAKTNDYLLADLIEIIDERGADINEPENTLSDRQILKITPSRATGIVCIILKNEQRRQALRLAKERILKNGKL